MPRKAARSKDVDSSVDTRVTRRSTRVVGGGDSPASSPSKPKEPASKKSKYVEDDHEEDDLLEEEEEEDEKAPSQGKKTTRKTARTQGGKGKRKRASNDSDEDAAGPDGDVNVPRNRRQRITAPPPADVSSPRRQSSRGAAKAAAAAIEQQAVKDEEVEDDEEETREEETPKADKKASAARGRKRKVPEGKEEKESPEDEEELQAEKKKKVEDEEVAKEDAVADTEKKTVEKDPESKDSADAPVEEPPKEEAKNEAKNEAKATALVAEGSGDTSDTCNGDSYQGPASEVSTIQRDRLPVHSSPTKKLNGEPVHWTPELLFARQFIRNPQLPDGFTEVPEQQFSIVSYNILADCCSIKGKDNCEQYKWITKDQLFMKSRHERFLKELTYLDADIVCLQEVESQYFEQQLKPAMESLGYDGHHMKRFKLEEWITDGEAFFFKTNKFELETNKGFVLHELAEKGMDSVGMTADVKAVVKEAIKESAVLISTQLRHKVTSRLLTLGVTHISWGGLKRQDIQCVQIASAIKELVSQAGSAEQPHLICGDFNSPPTTPGYQLAHDGYLNDDNVTRLQQIKVAEYEEQKSAVINLWWKGFQHTSPVLRSAYYTVQGHEPISSKFPHDNVCRAVDYIWYSHTSCDLVGILETVPEEVISMGIPNHICPSDHVSLKAVLQLK